MILETDVKCLYCGRVSWRVQCKSGAWSRTAVQVWPQLVKPLPGRPRCQHCGGPVYLDEERPKVAPGGGRMARPASAGGLSSGA